jgi:hypothetical protein
VVHLLEVLVVELLELQQMLVHLTKVLLEEEEITLTIVLEAVEVLEK